MLSGNLAQFQISCMTTTAAAANNNNDNNNINNNNNIYNNYICSEGANAVKQCSIH